MVSPSQSPEPLQSGSSSNQQINDPNRLEATSAPAGRFELPYFIKQNVRLWFAQIEQKLTVHRISTEKAKFANVASSLPPEIAAQVSDLLFNPPATNSYTTLKTRIIQEYEDSAQQKTNKLLEECELGDQKPTALLRKMRQLADSRVNDEFPLNLFLQRLPDNVRMVLTTTGVTDIDKAAEAADKAMEFVRPNYRVSAAATTQSAAATTQSAPTTDTTLIAIQQQILALTEAVSKLVTANVNAVETDQSSYGRRHSRSRAHTPDHHRRSPSRTRHELCWYHYRHGAAAHQCRQPCSFNNAPTSGNDQARH